MLLRSSLFNWSRSMLILLRSTFFQSTSLKLTLPLKSRLLKQLLQSMSMSPPSQPPPHTPQSSQSTAAAQMAPVTAPAKKVAAGIPVVGIRIGIVADRLPRIVRLVEHLRLILRNVDHLRIGRLDDDVVVLLDDLHLVVGLDHALGDRLVAQLLDGDQHVLLLVGDGVAERLRPFEVVAHHLDDLGIVEQRDHAAVPALLRLQVLVLGVLVEVARRLDDLQRIERCRGDDGDQLVRIERDPRDQHLHLVGAQRLRRGRSVPRSVRRRHLLLRKGRHGRQGRRHQQHRCDRHPDLQSVLAGHAIPSGFMFLTTGSVRPHAASPASLAPKLPPRAPRRWPPSLVTPSRFWPNVG